MPVKENEQNVLFYKEPFCGRVVSLVYLLIGALLLVLVVGMQVQMRSMIKKLDELSGLEDTSKE